jgi:hypothetical protein
MGETGLMELSGGLKELSGGSVLEETSVFECKGSEYVGMDGGEVG